jgi:hypothetical protein
MMAYLFNFLLLSVILMVTLPIDAFPTRNGLLVRNLYWPNTEIGSPTVSTTLSYAKRY